ncbi:hypothetical protein I6J18_19920 [Peribacillus psychrosaccharolyticus]|uniref:Uncharacterized protein n=1 Tax=Peribacillus psychrosaccharolyticus TaxID=1407 RepID=A0A974NLC4_PERPY|nr:hypothetical protein [Peribacillus psychrosaccharolyticus]MEC2054424.1 hypothetical protein [Peribacillus psychrosaccharolyticus]MED3744348.1 hypothetical protein [Peribacillus psychrosaccharolyticus]QQS99826.1 hypothetical protein I6J18_19920 [Peribacillus psychrosaccharolyticus]
MYTRIVKYGFLLLFLILLIIHLAVGLKHGFWIVIVLAILQAAAYTMAEKADQSKKLGE